VHRPEWFNRIRSRQITYLGFKGIRLGEHGEVSGLLTTVLRGLSSGATRILEVGDEEKFKSRLIPLCLLHNVELLPFTRRAIVVIHLFRDHLLCDDHPRANAELCLAISLKLQD
jgi:hypothetical protein